MNEQSTDQATTVPDLVQTHLKDSYSTTSFPTPSQMSEIQSAAIDWLDTADIPNSIVNPESLSPTAVEYKRRLIKAIRVLNQRSPDRTYTFDTSLLEIARAAELTLETAYIQGLNLEADINIEDHPQRLVQQLVSHPELIFNAEGERASLQQFIQERYRSLIENGHGISIDQVSPDEAIRRITAGTKWEEYSRHHPDDPSYLEFLQRINLDPNIQSVLNELGVTIPILRITTPSGHEYQIPIINNPVHLSESSAYATFSSYNNMRSDELISGWINVSARSFADYDTGDTHFLDGFSSLVHEIDHAVYSASSESYFVHQTQAINAQIASLSLERSDLIKQALSDLGTDPSHPLISQRQQLIQQSHTLGRTSGDPALEAQRKHINSQLAMVEIDIIKAASSHQSNNAARCQEIADEISSLESKRLEMSIFSEHLQPYIQEGLARHAQHYFLIIQRSGMKRTLERQQAAQVSGLGDFHALNTLYLRDIRSGSLPYGIGYLLTLPIITPDQPVPTHLYDSDFLSNFYLNNPEQVLPSLQYFLGERLIMHRMLHPDIDPIQRGSIESSIINRTLKDINLIAIIFRQRFTSMNQEYEQNLTASHAQQAEMLAALTEQIAQHKPKVARLIQQKHPDDQPAVFQSLLGIKHLALPAEELSHAMLSGEIHLPYATFARTMHDEFSSRTSN